MLRKVYLEGELGEKYGKVAEVKAESIREVIQYLQANYEGVDKYFIDSTEERNIGFVIKIADDYIEDERELLLPLEKGDIIITPTPMGAKGVFKVIVGIIIIAVTLVIAGGAALTAPMWIAIGIGAGLIMMGIAEMMMPDPATDDETPAEEEGYVFQGSEASIVEGYPVPILYGELRVPGQPITFNLQNTSVSLIDRNQNAVGGTATVGDEQGNYYSDYSFYGEQAL
tara:strand:+ start:5287 stop:5967 length:681 start_codon:yes stop_codon:yes gene_type:complete